MPPTEYRTPAIVCDADKLSQVAIIQELGRLGIPVIALSANASALGFASKYVSQRIVCPVPSYDRQYLEFLLSSVPHGVLFYSNDANAENIARGRGRLVSAGFALLISDIDTLERVIDKDRLYTTGKECGISVPECAFVWTIGEAKDKVEEYGLPVIVKATNLAGGVYRLVEDRSAIATVFREMSEIVSSEDHRHRRARLMVQRWIPQANTRLWNFNACVKGGEIVSFSMGERIRSDIYPDGRLGSILLFGRTNYNERIHALNRRLLEHLRFDGIVETEWSESNSEASSTYLYDFNPRPSGNIRWTFKSGVSLAKQYYSLALGLDPEPQKMRIGVAYAKVFYRWSDPIEALDSSRLTLGQKVSALKDDLWAVLGCHHHAVDVLELADLRPTIRASAQLCGYLYRRLRRSLTRRSRNSTPVTSTLKQVSQQ